MDASRGDSRKFQIFVKVDGKRTVAMGVSPKYKVHAAVEKILNTVSGSDQDVCVACEGSALRVGEELKSCGV